MAPLEHAGPAQISFLDNARYLDQAATTRAAACLIRPRHAGRLPHAVARLLTAEPYQGYARVAAAFYPDAAAPDPRHPPAPAIAAGAAIDPSASLGEGCRIAAGAVIGARRRARRALPDRRRRGDRRGRRASAATAGSVPGATLGHCLIGDRV